MGITRRRHRSCRKETVARSGAAYRDPAGDGPGAVAALAAATALLLGAAVLSGCGTAASAPEKPPAAAIAAPVAAGKPASKKPAETEPRASDVKLATPIPSGESYPSSLYVEKDVKVAARTSGVVHKVMVDRGASVRAGQPLGALETDVPVREVEMAEQELRLARADYDRLRPLNDSKIVSPQEFQRAEVAKDVAASALALSKARLDLYTMYAPFDGVVVERWAIVGQRVQVDDDTPLFRVASREALRARIDVPEEKALGITAGARARVDIPGAAGLEAKVVFVGPARDAASGTVPVIVELARPTSAAVLGASAMVHIEEGGDARARGGPAERSRARR
jgi:RND family efflux transporter MFP subunit